MEGCFLNDWFRRIFVINSLVLEALLDFWIQRVTIVEQLRSLSTVLVVDFDDFPCFGDIFPTCIEEAGQQPIGDVQWDSFDGRRSQRLQIGSGQTFSFDGFLQVEPVVVIHLESWL